MGHWAYSAYKDSQKNSIALFPTQFAAQPRAIDKIHI